MESKNIGDEGGEDELQVMLHEIHELELQREHHEDHARDAARALYFQGRETSAAVQRREKAERLKREKQEEWDQTWASYLRLADKSKELTVFPNQGLTEEYIPSELFDRKLHRLHIIGQEISEIPPRLCEMTSLTNLSLNTNHFRALPPGFGALTALRHLSLCHNQLAQLPRSLGNLCALETLDLSSNCLQFLPDSVGQLSRLRVLKADCNQLLALPATLPTMTSLRVLSANNNNLDQLGEAVTDMAGLERLSLSGNSITFLPPQLYKMAALRRLELCNNNLEAIPPRITATPRLQVLWLDWNDISKIPVSFRDMLQLRELKMEGNPLEQPSIHLVAEGVDAVREFCDEKLAADMRGGRKAVIEKFVDVLRMVPEEDGEYASVFRSGVAAGPVVNPEEERRLRKAAAAAAAAEAAASSRRLRGRSRGGSVAPTTPANAAAAAAASAEAEAAVAGSSPAKTPGSGGGSGAKKQNWISRKVADVRDAERRAAVAKTTDYAVVLDAFYSTILPGVTPDDQDPLIVFPFPRDVLEDAINNHEDNLGPAGSLGVWTHFTRCGCTDSEGRRRVCMPVKGGKFKCTRRALRLRMAAPSQATIYKLKIKNEEKGRVGSEMREAHKKAVEFVASREGKKFFRDATFDLLRAENSKRRELKALDKRTRHKRKGWNSQKAKFDRQKASLEKKERALRASTEKDVVKLTAALAKETTGWKIEELQKDLDLANHRLATSVLPREDQLSLEVVVQKIKEWELDNLGKVVKDDKRRKEAEEMATAEAQSFLELLTLKSNDSTDPVVTKMLYLNSQTGMKASIWRTRNRNALQTRILARLKLGYVDKEVEEARERVEEEYRILRLIQARWNSAGLRAIVTQWRLWAVNHRINRIEEERKAEEIATLAKSTALVAAKLRALERAKWEEKFDEFVERVYYVHSETGEVAWEIPDRDFVARRKPGVLAAAAEAAEEESEEEGEKDYGYGEWD